MRLASHSRRGFTLVEMLVVFGIIALVLGLSVPVFSVIYQGRSIRGAADVVQGCFLKYREKAAASGKPVFLVVEHWQVPPRIAAWNVDRDPVNPNNFIFTREPGDAMFPEQVAFDQNWVTSVAVYSAPAAGMPYRDECIALCTANIMPDGPNYNFPAKPNPENRAYIIICMPSGACQIIGRANVPTINIDTVPPTNGDMILNNIEQRMFIDINPATGRIRFAEPVDN